VSLLEITVDNLAQATAADQQADEPRAKWVATLSFRIDVSTTTANCRSFGPHIGAAPGGLTKPFGFAGRPAGPHL
jgi:hypothetical protein